ncbi:hypothetical protein THOB06_230012 [Vibrio rotiferianus]|nr:hypothetical protein THOG10_230013 [Vibrio rotiferianus]CAH1576859.1 hypothetical protein THOB06_230012 [Vibrio rotiferianus]CAH1606422.1 hypothetical protein THF5G08_260013 [Vibrio jasicida]
MSTLFSVFRYSKRPIENQRRSRLFSRTEIFITLIILTESHTFPILHLNAKTLLPKGNTFLHLQSHTAPNKIIKGNNDENLWKKPLSLCAAYPTH